MSVIREAVWAETNNYGGETGRYWRVGMNLYVDGGVKDVKAQPVTRITVQEDVPGMHCNLWRVCIWVGETLAAEVPYVSICAIGYAT